MPTPAQSEAPLLRREGRVSYSRSSWIGDRKRSTHPMFETISQPITSSLAPDARGRAIGSLAAGEEVDAVLAALVDAPLLALNREVDLLVHADLQAEVAPGAREKEQESKRNRLRDGKLKRYVFEIKTCAGPRIIKIAEVQSLGNQLLGLFGRSVARREHKYHLQCESLGVAATQTLGYLEWRSGGRTVRSCQLQSALSDKRPSLDRFLADELREHGDAALESLAEAIAKTHAVPFFHADLKGFHAVVDKVQRPNGTASRYDLLWIDLARVSFHLTRRKRIINLYQALRFVIPKRPDAEERFVEAYCRASGWYSNNPAHALQIVRKFLAYKYRTYPLP